jgi:hypothetical protein
LIPSDWLRSKDLELLSITIVRLNPCLDAYSSQMHPTVLQEEERERERERENSKPVFDF